MIYTRTQIPGKETADRLNSALRRVGIGDVQFMYDKDIEPLGMWAVVQVKKRGGILLPDHYQQYDIQPMIMWWCKDHEGRFRLPNDRDLSDIVATVQRAHKIWDKGGDWLADRFDEQSAEKDRKHNERQHERIRSIAPAMKKAIRESNL